MKTRIFVFLCMSFFGLFAFASAFYLEKPTKEAFEVEARDADSLGVASDSVSLSPADELLAKARDYIIKARYDSAGFFAEEARLLYMQSDNKRGIVQSVYEKSKALARAGRFSDSNELIKQNVEQSGEWFSENDVDYARSLSQLGYTTHKLGEYDAALKLQKRALDLQLANENISQIENARVLNRIGVIYAERGLYTDALSYYTKSVSIARKVHGLKHHYVAQNYNNIGNLYKNLGDFGRSLEYHHRALSIRKEIFDHDHPAVAASQFNIGNVFGSMGESDLALHFHKKSLQLFETSLANDHPYILINLNAISQDYIGKGEYINALVFLNKSLELLNGGSGSLGLEGDIYRTKGDIYLEQQETLNAEQNYAKSLYYYSSEQGHDIRDLLMSLNDLMDLFTRKGNYEKALEYFAEAIVNNLKSGFPYLEDSLDITHFHSTQDLQASLTGKARIYYEIGKLANKEEKTLYLEKSLNALTALIGVIHQNRRSFEFEESKLFLNEQFGDINSIALSVTNRLYELSGDRKFLEKALFFMEQGKTTILRDAINESNAIQYASLPDSLVDLEKRLRSDLVFYDQKIRSEEAKGVHADSTLLSRWQATTFELNLSYNALRDSLEVRYPEYNDLKYSNYVASLDDIRNNLIGDKDALLEYFIGSDSLYILAITEDDVKLVHTANDSSFNDLVGAFRTSILNQDQSAYSTSGSKLYQELIAPVLDVIGEKEHWIIAPHGELNYLPFEALPVSEFPVGTASVDVPYVLRGHSLRYIYSATIEIQTNKRKADSWSKDFIAFAPVFEEGISTESAGAQLLSGRRGTAKTIKFEVDGETVSWPRADVDSTSVDEIKDGWGYLPYTRQEVEDITRLFKNGYSWGDRLWRNKASVYMEHEATEAKLKSTDLTDHRFVHFATHGAINESIPELSGIILAQDTTGGEDGVLHLGEIYNLELNADLVVLSACETGLGKLEGGEGIIGLARGFKYAGANSLLVSLWPVDDASTRKLMTSFYGDVLGGKAKAEAVRQAKLKLINGSALLSDPFYWAGFILIGG